MEFNILDRDRVCDEEMMRERAQELIATETPNNIAILSKTRQEQVSYFNVSFCSANWEIFVVKS